MNVTDILFQYLLALMVDGNILMKEILMKCERFDGFLLGFVICLAG